MQFYLHIIFSLVLKENKMYSIHSLNKTIGPRVGVKKLFNYLIWGSIIIKEDKYWAAGNQNQNKLFKILDLLCACVVVSTKLYLYF